MKGFAAFEATTFINQLLVFTCDKKLRHVIGRYTVTVKKDGMIIGHLSRKMSRVWLLFLRSPSLSYRYLRCHASEVIGHLL